MVAAAAGASGPVAATVAQVIAAVEAVPVVVPAQSAGYGLITARATPREVTRLPTLLSIPAAFPL